MKIAVVTTLYTSEDQPLLGLKVQREVEGLRAAGHDVRVIHLNPDLETGTQVVELSLDAPILHFGVNPSNLLSVARTIGPLRRAVAFADVVEPRSLPAALRACITRGR